VLFAGFVDNDLTPAEMAKLSEHLASCAACRQELAAFSAIDAELTDWGEAIEHDHAAVLGSGPVPSKTMRWASAVAAIAAVLTLAMGLLLQRTPVVQHEAARFKAIPYLPPLDAHENAMVVRMDVRVASLIAAGYKVPDDPDRVVPAEALVGEDGRVHAIRVLSGIEWN